MTFTEDWSQRGPALWAELHRWALCADPSTTGAWLDRFAARIPCGPCRRHWLEMIAQSPPPTESHDALFAWTVQRHNQVNQRIAKPELTLDEARQRWMTEPESNVSQHMSREASMHGQWWRNRRMRRLHRGFDATGGADPRPDETNPFAAPPDIPNLFDAVWCINLDADAQRWEEFNRRLAACDWPFRPVTRFSAVHGDTVGVPNHYHQGGGAWGCLRSHVGVLERSLMAGHQRILVMEDDADLRPGFGAAVRGFLKNLGDQPWDCLMLGGQHMSTPRPLKAGVVRAANIQRTHCMAFSQPFMRALYRYWSGPLDQHCDWALGPFATRFNTFAPERFLVGQRGGRSWITGSGKPPEWWNPPPPHAPVVWLRAPRPVLEACRDIFHAGNRRNADGICVGLADVFHPAKHSTDQRRIDALKSWIAMIQWEVESRSDGSVCTIWHPAASADIVKAAAGEVLVEIEAVTAEQARERIAPILPPAR